MENCTKITPFGDMDRVAWDKKGLAIYAGFCIDLIFAK